jgi:hypothetical protein
MTDIRRAFVRRSGGLRRAVPAPQEPPDGQAEMDREIVRLVEAAT